MQLNRVLLPTRFAHRAAGRALAAAAQIKPAGDNDFEVELPRQGLRFYWPRQPDNNLWFVIEQEFDARNPHHYTTPPIQLGPESLVLDVGACEGLFAFRTIKQGLGRRVICFEPGETMARLLRRGAEVNDVAGQITVERLAVDRQSGWAYLDEAQDAEASSIRADNAVGEKVEAVSLDDYCRRKALRLSPQDLIKIDAEGADWDILRGAEELIRTTGPQLAVTTYHTDRHCFEIADWLNQVRPDYRLRLKGFASWTERPRPVLLQAAIAAGPHERAANRR